MSGQYNLVTPGLGRKPTVPEVPDAYHSPFLPGGHSSFVWSERAMPLAHILKDNSLPLVVKISDEANVRTEGESTMDFRQPLLLYREHQVWRLYARNVASSGSGKKEVGPYVVIPQNYRGLFRPSGQPASPITCMATMARLMPPSMLSTSPCDGYICVSALESDVLYQKTSLEPGLYVIKDLLEDDITIQGGRQKSRKKKVVRCLRCVNDNGKCVLFPLKATGEFFVAAVDAHSSRHTTLDASCRVYLWRELTQDMAGPAAAAGAGAAGAAGAGASSPNNNCEVIADLVYGKPPPQECQFTGTLAFKHVTKDDTVIGCTTSEETSRLFELSPVNKGPNFVFALNQDCFDAGGPLTKCLKFAKQEMDRYVSEMKVRRDYEVESRELRESSS